MLKMKNRIQRNQSLKSDNMVDSFKIDIQEALEHEDVTCGVTFIKHNTGEISVITTEGDAIEVMGVIEVGKQLVFKDRWDD